VTCRTIEQRARETIESAFAADLASGRLVWRVLNMEKKEYEHSATDTTSRRRRSCSRREATIVRFAVLKDTGPSSTRRRFRRTSWETLAFLEG
jgi:hypothetical protein